MSPTSAEGGTPHPSDRVWGPLWVVLGAAMMVGASRIDRLQSQGVEWFAAPGLLPGLLGAIIALSGLLIALRARHGHGAARPGATPAVVPADEHAADFLIDPTAEAETVLAQAPHDWRRIALALALCLGFAAGLVGHGLHFGVAAGLYLFTHITLLQWHERRAAEQTARGLLVAAGVALGGALLVPFIFESVFLVRLP